MIHRDVKLDHFIFSSTDKNKATASPRFVHLKSQASPGAAEVGGSSDHLGDLRGICLAHSPANTLVHPLGNSLGSRKDFGHAWPLQVSYGGDARMARAPGHGRMTRRACVLQRSIRSILFSVCVFLFLLFFLRATCHL